MPELPDVDGFRRLIDEHAVGRRIIDVQISDATTVHGAPLDVRGALVGQLVESAERHGKWITVHAGGRSLLLHFGMTGALRWTISADPLRAERFRLAIGDGALVDVDRRNLGTIALVPDGVDATAITGPLGPDARVINDEQLAAVLASRQSLKAALLHQPSIAGLGNMLTDEILWRARLDPAQRADRVDELERRQLRVELRDVLRRATAAGHIPRGRTWLSGQRTAVQPRCPRCGTELQWRRVAGRSSLWCPNCQQQRPASQAGGSIRSNTGTTTT